MVKVATTKSQRKLFFHLRRMKTPITDEAADAAVHRNTLSREQVERVARDLNVKPEEVLEMETRMSGGDVAMESQNDDGEEAYAPIASLAADRDEPTRVIENAAHDRLAGAGIGEALETLDPRSRRIVEERYLKVNDASSGARTR